MVKVRIGGWAGVALALWVTLMVPTPLPAACRSPLPTASLQSLDERIDADPAGVLSEAQRRLDALRGVDPLQSAELAVLIADAASLLDDDSRVRIAVARGRAWLLQLPDGAQKRALEIRLDVTAADSPEGATDMAASIDRLTQLEQSLPTKSLARACLLIVRSRLNTQLIRDEEATSDGMSAYRLASDLKVSDAIADAAYQLAFTYLRAGLLDDAQPLVGEANAYYQAAGKTARLSDGLYIQADILEQMHQYDRALAVNAEARALNVQQHQTLDVAFDDEKKCSILLALQRLEAAQQTCMAAEPVLAAAGRADLVAVIEGSLARIDITRGQPAAAIARLDRVLASGVDQIPAKVLPKLYQFRSEALDHVGRFKDALRDLQEADRLSEASGAARHSLAAARLKERATAANADQEKRTLAAEVLEERQRTTSQARQLRVRLALATAAGLLLVAMVYHMWKRARQEHTLRAAAETLESQAHIISTLREAVLLVDGLGQIKYANPASQRLFERSEAELLGCRAEQLGIGPGLQRSAGADTKVGAAAGVYDLQWIDAHGKVHSLLLTCSAVALHERPLTVCILQDVTQLRQLERRVFSEASGERNQVSSEIHEGLAQELTGISLLLKSVTGKSSSDEAMLGYLRDLVPELIETSVTLVQGLSPVQIALGSLPDALSRFAAEQSLVSGRRVSCYCELGALQLGPWQADHLFRIVQACTELAVGDGGNGNIALEVRLAGEVLTLVTTVECTKRAEQLPDTDRDWDRIVYLTKIIGGSARMAAIPPSGVRRAITVPLAALMVAAVEKRNRRPDDEPQARQPGTR